MQTTWTSLKPRNLPVQSLSRYALVIHSYHMSKPVESSFTEYVHTVVSSSGSDLFICYSVLPGNAKDAPLPYVMSSIQPMWITRYSQHWTLVPTTYSRSIHRFVVSAVQQLNLHINSSHLPAIYNCFRLCVLFFICANMVSWWYLYGALYQYSKCSLFS